MPIYHREFIRLLGGLRAQVCWTDAGDEGDILVHPSWAANNPEVSRAWRVACAEADRVAGRAINWSCVTG